MRFLVIFIVAAAFGAAIPAQAQVETYYVETSGTPSTTIYDAPSTTARVLGVYSSPIILTSVGVETGADGREYEIVEPLPGSGLGWRQGYVLSSEVNLTADARPLAYGAGIFGSVGTASIGAHALSGVSTSNPLGKPGNLKTYGGGIGFEVGKYIPAGHIGPVGRLLVDYSYIAVNSTLNGLDRTQSSLTRVGLGGDLVYRLSAGIDISAGAVATGGLYRQAYATSFDTLRFDARLVGADVTAGLGYGRAAVTGLRLRLEGGYRFATRIGEWSLSSAQSGESQNVTFSGEEPLNVSGPIARVVVGISFGGSKPAPRPAAGIPSAPLTSDEAPMMETGSGDAGTAIEEAQSMEPEVPPVAIPPSGRDRIRWVQTTLTRLSYDCGIVDGRMGNDTRACVRAYQSNKGLSATGEINDATLDALSQER